jgi:chemotaxis protein methyltransferase CheR
MPSTASHDIDDYESLLVALQNDLGVVVPESQRSCLLERLEPLLASYSLDSLSALASSLQRKETDEIRSSVLEVISKGRSGWSLSPVLINVLHKYIFDELADKARIWLVGCGEGQLAYTIAMEIAEYENKTGQTKNFQLFATDSSLSDIKHAESACYSSQRVSRLTDGYKKLYAAPAGEADNWVIKDKIRQRVQFSQCDLTEDFQSMGEMDLIICPDVLVYFSNGVKAGILQQFSSLLKPGGILLTGYNQAVTPFTDSFERVEHPAGVFYRQKK